LFGIDERTVFAAIASVPPAAGDCRAGSERLAKKRMDLYLIVKIYLYIYL